MDHLAPGRFVKDATRLNMFFAKAGFHKPVRLRSSDLTIAQRRENSRQKPCQ